jgi:hypothetical protein
MTVLQWSIFHLRQKNDIDDQNLLRATVFAITNFCLNQFPNIKCDQGG